MFSNYLLIGNWLIDRLRELTSTLDKAVYGLVNAVYQVFLKLAEIDLLGTRDGQNILTNITQRIYILLGIVMIFILAFNLLNYIVDPDKVKDKQVGASTFIKDVIIALVVISVLPTIFSKLYSFQKVILEEGVVANLILGGYQSEDENADTNPVGNGANQMIASVYVTFLRPADGTTTSLDCDDPSKVEGIDDFSGYCDAYKAAKGTVGIRAFDKFITNSDYDFPLFMTTIAGIALLIFMVIFCFQLAKRVGKLAILQLIAPVPFTLEIVPNKKGTRKKWIETLFKVYADVFVYLAIIYFIVLLISLIPSALSGIFGATDGFFALVATIILTFGLLMFAKEAPQMLLDLLGIKSTSLIKDSFAMGKKGAGMAAFLGGTAGSMIGNFSRNVAETKGTTGNKFGNFFQRVGSGFGGAASSLSHNIMGAKNVHSIKDATNLRRQTNQTVLTNRMNRDAYQRAHPGHFGATRAHISELGTNVGRGVSGFFGGSTQYQKNKHTEQVNRDYKKLYQDSIESLWKSDSKWQAYSAEFNRATAAGDHNAAANAQRAMDARRDTVLNLKKLQFMEGVGKLNNFIDANQGVDGITVNRLNMDDVASIHDSASANTVFNTIKNEVEDTGFKPTLKSLSDDKTYQTQRVQEKLKADAKEATKKAAEQANQNKSGDKK